MGGSERHADATPAAANDDRPLQPFRTHQSPGLSFARGYCLCPIHYSTTPTHIDGYDEVWLITPDGERRLYSDPSEAGPLTQQYHKFDRTVGASITWEHASHDRVALHLDGEDGTTVDLRATLGVTTGIRLLNMIASLTPRPILRTSIGETVTNLSFAQFIDTNGMKIAGTTETGEPYRAEADTIRAVTSASATVNDDDLGDLTKPDRPIEFGDHIVPNEPLFVFGALYLRPPPAPDT